jgi:hypothetical protein
MLLALPTLPVDTHHNGGGTGKIFRSFLKIGALKTGSHSAQVRRLVRSLGDDAIMMNAKSRLSAFRW